MLKIFSAICAIMFGLVGIVLNMAMTFNNDGAYGVDISWPQCNKAVPSDPQYVIVGVNNGNANSTNPCLQAQLKTARILTQGNANGLQYYVNTGNPGFADSGKSGAWPSGNTYRGMRIDIPDTFGGGTCKGKENYNNTACAYVYGWSRAYDDAHRRGVSEASKHMWWLDVEEINSWNYDNQKANRAVLEGMHDYFSDKLHVKVGLYTVTKMWSEIVGELPADSPLDTLPVWYPIGEHDQQMAALTYHLYPSPTRGKIVMVQYIQDGIDYNYSETFTPTNQRSLINQVLNLFYP